MHDNQCNLSHKCDIFLFEQQFSAINQQFKEIIFDNCWYFAGNCCSHNREIRVA